MKFVLLYDASNPAAIHKDFRSNKGIDLVIARPENFRPDGQPLHIEDTGQMSEPERMEKYFQAIAPSVLKKYRVRKVFGTQRNAGISFGRGVPALLVWPDEGDFPIDVYPHEMVGRTVTIYEFLKSRSSESRP